MKKILLGVAALSVAIPALPGVAAAQGYRDRDGRYEQDYRQDYGRQDYRRDYRDDRRDRRANHRDQRRYAAYYDRQGYYTGPQWRGQDGRYYCNRSDGSTGLLIGGVAGALVGRSVDRYGDRTGGTVIGALLGAVIGSAIDKDNQRNSRARCR